MNWYRRALEAAEVRPETLGLAALAVVNAIQASDPELCATEAVLLVDIGAQSTSTKFLRGGVPLMTRIMHIGGRRIVEAVAQALMMSPVAAEKELSSLRPQSSRS